MLKGSLSRSICVLIAMIIIFQATGCSYFTSPMAIEALTKDVQVDTFYGEGKGMTCINGEPIQEYDFVEWKGYNKDYCIEAEIRTKKEYFEECYDQEITGEMLDGDIVITSEKDIYNDSEIIIYEPYINQYSIKSVSFVDEVSEKDNSKNMNDILQDGSLKSYVMDMITKLEADYNLSIENDVKINGYLTQHIKAEAKEKDKKSQYDFWVDQNTWMVVKEREILGNYIIQTEYTKFELNPKVDSNLFKVDIPKDASVQYLDNNLEKTNEEVTLDEAVRKLKSPVFYLDDQSIQSMGIHYIESIDDQYGRVEITYHTQDGNEFIVRSSPSSIIYEKLNLGYEQIDLGDIKANYIETGSSKYIEFIKDGTICDVYIKNSELTKEQLIDLANKLKEKG